MPRDWPPSVRREPTDHELGRALCLMGVLAVAGCLLGSLAVLLLIGLAERPDPEPIDYVFRQRWTWINAVAPALVAPFPGACIGVMLARHILEQRELLPWTDYWSRLRGLGERLAGLPAAGGVAGALLYVAVNPGPGLIGAGVRRLGNTTGGGSIPDVGALILAGMTVGWGLGMLLTGLGLRRRVGTGEPGHVTPAQATCRTCTWIGLAGLAGCAAGAGIAWLLFGLADRPLELVRDAGPPSREQWDWLNEARHVLVGAAFGLFAGMIAGRVVAEPRLRGAGFEGMPYRPLGRIWRWLVGPPVLAAAAAAVFYELQNPDRIFDMTLPIVLGSLVGIAVSALLAASVLAGRRSARSTPLPNLSRQTS